MAQIGKNAMVVLCVGLLCICIPVSIAVAKGIDGTLMSSYVGAICLLIGGALGFRIAKKGE